MREGRECTQAINPVQPPRADRIKEYTIYMGVYNAAFRQSKCAHQAILHLPTFQTQSQVYRESTVGDVQGDMDS